ncbi:MAG: adenylate/guanylate cyclase domain-containing protein [Azospirillaceae bacterium]
MPELTTLPEDAEARRSPPPEAERRPPGAELATDGVAGAEAPIRDWLLGPARRLNGPGQVLSGLAEHLTAAGVPVWRMTFHMPKLHPQMFGVGYIWTADDGCTVENQVGHDMPESEIYLKSPIRTVHETHRPVRCKLCGPEADFSYPIVRELADQGATDYALMPIELAASPRPGAMGLSTKAPDGFEDAAVALVERLMPAIATVLELHLSRLMTQDLLTSYVGREAARRILDGEIMLGRGMRIDAVVLFCDMRDFSQLMETLPRDQLGELMRDYFACVVEAVHEAEGDVLKFMGDGLLAIFPVETAEGQEVACVRALMAAQKTFQNLDQVMAERRAAGKPTARAGMALHFGDMFYGNIGAGARLDFTVMGPAVNRAARIEELTRNVEERILTSAEFAHLCPVRLQSIGRFPLKGLAGEHEIFVPLLDERATGGD